jgi:hypothetical protein
MLKTFCTRILLFLLLAYLAGCSSSKKQPEQMKLSESYLSIRSFMESANLTDPDIVYFYTGTPKLPLPNAYCFDTLKNQLISTVTKFSELEDYVSKLKGGLIDIKQPGISLDSFLVDMPMVDAYDRPVEASALTGYNYYLFLDFLAVGNRGLMATLSNTKKAAEGLSGKRIKLFLVHAISAQNRKKLKGIRIGNEVDTANYIDASFKEEDF